MTEKATSPEQQIPCPNCGGVGREEISLDMAIDAGDRTIAGSFAYCPYCNGDGWILVEGKTYD